ncbi:glycoside hydrolase superfamily [Aspergillus keveii]|uniref:glucan 1,3-beta-glucosidase n=1 Tax=Aspergillus keveii TaxID=714993 RepID=A0ABR4FNG8_9EURO
MNWLILTTLLPSLGTLVAATEYIDWTTYKANGVNLGGWLVQESFIDSAWWAAHSKCAIAPDEWTLCANLGRSCGPVLEERYASWITTQDIDRLHAANVNTLRIPTNYAAWVEVPGTKLYSGRQVEYLRKIATYAIEKYQMHVIIDLHALPGGTNGMGHGEAEGHYGWFHNQTALDYSLDAVDAVLEYIQQSGHPESYTIEPINEPVDNRDLSTFGSPLSLSDAGASWVLRYITAVLDKVAAVNPKIPIMFQGGFLSTTYWSSKLDPSANLVFDVHNYYFVGRDAAGHNLTSYICTDAQVSSDPILPVFVGEWSIEAEYQNSLDGRELALNTGLYAFDKHTRGSAYWTAKCFGDAAVDGEGVQADYWNYLAFAEQRMLNPNEAADVCAQ